MKKLSLLTLVCCAGAAPVAEAAVVRTSSVSRSITVAPGTERTLTLSCRGTSVALSGAARSGLDTLTGSFPRFGTRRWTFRFAAGDRARRASAVLRCVRLDLPKGVRRVRLRVGTALQRDVDVAAGATQGVTVVCPFGAVPTGWGFQRVKADDSLSVAAVVAKASGWRFTFENRGSSGAKVDPYIRCLDPVQRARGGRTHRFSIRTASFTDSIGPGSDSSAGHACRDGEFSLATGVALPPAEDIFLTGTHPGGKRRGRWSFRQPGATSTVDTTLRCLDRGTTFR